MLPRGTGKIKRHNEKEKWGREEKVEDGEIKGKTEEGDGEKQRNKMEDKV
jgi:hypothetical protein